MVPSPEMYDSHIHRSEYYPVEAPSLFNMTSNHCGSMIVPQSVSFQIREVVVSISGTHSVCSCPLFIELIG